MKEIECTDYEKWKSGYRGPMIGGAVGKSDRCPTDANEAHTIIQKSKRLEKNELLSLESSEKSIS